MFWLFRENSEEKLDSIILTSNQSSSIAMDDNKDIDIQRGEAPKSSKRMQFMQVLVTYSAAILFGMFSIRFMSYYNSTNNPSELVQTQRVQCIDDPPKYWGICIWQWNPFGNLRTMDRVFKRLGYASVNGTSGDDWDVLWSIEYPSKNISVFKPLFIDPLKPHQRVNHFFGTNYITAKSFMTTRNRDIKYVLPGFSFPNMIEEFKTYVKANPEAKFVQKGLANRGIKLVNQTEIKFGKSNVFYQRFMEKPFLVDGRFMDFAVFVLISSIDPLRVYRYANEVYVRFCPEPYYPFDATKLDQYVISDTREMFLQLPETKSYFDDYGFSFKLSLEDYFQKKGHNVTELWRKIDEAITMLVVNNEKHLVKETFKMFNSSHHFFELVRFDLLLNETLDPHISEVNMSPGITIQSELAERITSTNEQLLHDTLKLVGVGSKMDLMARYDTLTSQMTSNSKNIGVNVEQCVSNNCHQNCNKPECEMCTPCLSSSSVNSMHRAYREHVRRGGFKRIFPSKTHYNDEFISKTTPKNKISAKWFKAKCEENSDWC